MRPSLKHLVEITAQCKQFTQYLYVMTYIYMRWISVHLWIRTQSTIPISGPGELLFSPVHYHGQSGHVDPEEAGEGRVKVGHDVAEEGDGEDSDDTHGQLHAVRLRRDEQDAEEGEEAQALQEHPPATQTHTTLLSWARLVRNWCTWQCGLELQV